jgi:hypothetical protein
MDLIRLKRIYNFWCSMLVLHKLLYVLFTLWHFYAFSGTNLLTRCHGANSLFFAIFVFQKRYIGNILRIGQTLFHETYCKSPPSSPRDRQGPEPLPGTLSERGNITGGLIHHHASLQSDALIRPFCITIFFIIIYRYSLIYFIFRDDTYVISSVFTCWWSLGDLLPESGFC